MSAIPENTAAVATADEVRSEAAEDFLTRLRAFMEARDLTRTRVAKEAGVSPSALTQVLGGTYKGKTENVLKKLRSWLAEQIGREDASTRLPDDPAFFETRTATKIIDALRYAKFYSDLVVIYGGAGLGKTVTCEHFRNTNAGVWRVAMSPTTATPGAVLDIICQELGLTRVPHKAVQRQAYIVKKLAETRGLMIVDEAQHLTIQGLETVRAIHDASGVGLALCGNETVYAQLTGGVRAAHFAQLFSRVGMRLHLTRTLKADVEAMCDAWRVKGKTERDYLHKIASNEGGLRIASKVIRLASMLAGGKQLAVAHLRDAAGMLGWEASK